MSTTATITLPIRTPRRFNFRTGEHTYGYRAVPGLGWVAVWSEQDGPGPQWYRLADREGNIRDATRAEYDASFGRNGVVAYRVQIGIPQGEDATAFVPLDTLPDADAILARILVGDYPREDCYLQWQDRETARPYIRARV